MHSSMIELRAFLSPGPDKSLDSRETVDSRSTAGIAAAHGTATVDIAGLCRRMRAGEESAFTHFYDEYYDRLFRYLLLLTRGNESVSRELAQSTMTKAMQRMRAFNTEPQLWNWLAAIGRNSFIDTLRRTRTAPEIVSLRADDVHADATPSADGTDEKLIAALEDCLQEIAPDEREFIERFYFNDGSHRSLAEQRGTSVKSVESKLARIRHKLRSALLRKLADENDS